MIIPTTAIKWKLRNVYGLSLEEYNALFISQEGKCAICKVVFSDVKADSPHVDHDHSSGWSRGLLCHSCNVGIGLLKDSTDLLQAAIDYLVANETPTEFNIHAKLAILKFTKETLALARPPRSVKTKEELRVRMLGNTYSTGRAPWNKGHRKLNPKPRDKEKAKAQRLARKGLSNGK